MTKIFNIMYIGYKKKKLYYVIIYMILYFYTFSLEKITCALRAGAELAGIPVSNCILIAGTQYGVDGAVQIGMPCIVLRSR